MRTLRIDLGGRWEFRRTDSPDTREWRPACVPGCAQADLMAEGSIPDPFVGTNEDKVQWVSGARWEYRRRFDAPLLPAGARAHLVFEGLDTFATVLVNGEAVGTSDNMFIPFRFDVTDHLAAGSNDLAVRFDSTEARAAAAAQAYGVELKNVARAPNASFVRKAPCHFGWDWGPTLLTVGIWRPVRLEIVPRAYVDAIDAWGEPGETGAGTLGAAVEVAGPRQDGLRLEVIALAPDSKTEVGRAAQPLEGGRAAVTIPVARAELWWPNGMGRQPLYTLRVRLVAGDGAVADERTARVGIRRLELVRDPDPWGRTFFFRANGRPLFAKGANWIPADAMPHRVTPERYRDLLESCAAVRMNMLRVWGGGYYEDEAFYELCDELGLLVWQDFMFACAMYPGDDPAFAGNVEREAAAAVKHLRCHTSLALWCGNNEMESAWFEWGWNKQHPERIWHAYERLFHEMLPQAVARFDPRRPYIPSSPTSHEVGKPSDPASGDAHVWNVWHGQGSHLNYLQSAHRFVSEFGYQSIPSLDTMGPVIPPSERRLDLPSMLQHQKSPGGNEKIARAVEEWLGRPRDFESLIYLSQVYQAMAIRTGVEHWRRGFVIPHREGEPEALRHSTDVMLPCLDTATGRLKPVSGRTMGALYWQANDCWPVMSWAGLDYHGRWKALHYAARDFFAPYLVSGVAAGGNVPGAALYCTADFHAAPARASLFWQVRGWNGPVVFMEVQPVDLVPGKTVLAVNWHHVHPQFGPPKPGEAKPEITFDGPSKLAPEWLYVLAVLMIGEEPVSRTIVPLAPLARSPLPDPKIKAMVKVEAGTNRVWVDLKAEQVALAVYLDAPGVPGRFEKNFFDIFPGEERAAAFLPRQPLDTEGVEAFARRLRVRTLYDSRIA